MPYICWWYLLVHKIVDLWCNKYLWFSFHPNNENLNMKVVGTSYFWTIEGCKSSRNESDSITNTLFYNICKRLLAVFLSERFFSLRGIEFWAVDNIPKKQIVNSEKLDLMNVNILRGSCQVIYEENILNRKVYNILAISCTGISHIHFTSI